MDIDSPWSLSGHNPPVTVTFRSQETGPAQIRLNGRFTAANLSPTLGGPGQEPSVVVTFRLQEMRPAPIRLSGRFTAANLNPALARPGRGCVKTLFVV